MSTNATWTGGYVAELPYTYGYYRELSPSIHNFALALKGMALGAAATETFTYCELGCGQGVSSALLASVHPGAKFYATDFNPTHAVHARRLAAAAGLSNIEFFDDSFEEFLERDLPAFDVIALHGVYSWISPEARRSVVAFVRRKLKPGGVLYISYNVLPGWSAALPLREMMVAHAAGSNAPIAARIEAALAFANKMEKAGAKYFAMNPTVKPRLEQMGPMPRNYLAHEYFNRDWHPMYFSDIAAELNGAKMTYVGSAHLTDHVDPVNLSAEQISLLNEVTDPTLQETFRDFATNQQFRRDIFVKGPYRLALVEQLKQLHDIRFTLTNLPSDTPRTVNGLSGEATLQAEIYDPIIAALGAGPQTLDQLSKAPGVVGLDMPRLLQALTVLVGANSLQPSMRYDAKADALRKRSTDAFNRVLMERSQVSGDTSFLASPTICSGVQVDRFEQLYMLAGVLGRADVAEFVWAILRDQNQRLVRDGKTLETQDENIVEINERLAAFRSRKLPVLKQLGVA